MSHSLSPRATANGRWLIVAAAVLWSLSGLFTRILQRPTSLGLHEPALTAFQLAFFRAFFAGLVLVPLIRRSEIRFRPLMPFMVASFASMNALFVTAMFSGPAANAILLQNTAPFFVVLLSVFLFKEQLDRRSLLTLSVGMVGMLIIVLGGKQASNDETIRGGLDVTLMAVGSGLTYGLVILCLRALRTESSEWLASLNLLGSAICLGTAIALVHGITYWWNWITTPTITQLLFLLAFGAIQMGLPYCLFARGLRTVSPQEAGAITLLEPLLNPIWAYLISPETDTPTPYTWIGGSLIFAALVLRYFPRPAAKAK